MEAAVKSHQITVKFYDPLTKKVNKGVVLKETANALTLKLTDMSKVQVARDFIIGLSYYSRFKDFCSSKEIIIDGTKHAVFEHALARVSDRFDTKKPLQKAYDILTSRGSYYILSKNVMDSISHGEETTRIVSPHHDAVIVISRKGIKTILKYSTSKYADPTRFRRGELVKKAS